MLRNIGLRLAAPMAVVLAALVFTLPAQAETKTEKKKVGKVTGPTMPFNIAMPPTRPAETWTPNTMAESITPEARANFISTMMAVNPFSLRDMVAMMAVKYPAKEGLSFDDVVDAMKLKANEINFKLVGHSPLWKDVVAISGDKNTPRVEFFTFCDAMVARELLDYSLEFAIFLPCRIAVVEDANKKIWVLTLDWDVRWLDNNKNPNQISTKLRERSIWVREAIDKIMKAGAAGEF